jgi:hypothetical protein
LAVTAQAASLRLWGKIRGTERDYYIAEGIAAGGEANEEEGQVDMEPKGADGVNRWTYWVCNSPDELNWV